MVLLMSNKRSVCLAFFAQFYEILRVCFEIQYPLTLPISCKIPLTFELFSQFQRHGDIFSARSYSFVKKFVGGDWKHVKMIFKTFKSPFVSFCTFRPADLNIGLETKKILLKCKLLLLFFLYSRV